MNPAAHSDKKFPLTDEELVKMIGLDHEWALKEIFLKYHTKLYRMAVGVLGMEDVSKDIVQEIFIDLWNRRHSSHIQSLSGYLCRAVKFQVLKQLRDGKLLDHHLELVENLRFANHTQDALEFQDLERTFLQAVDQLPVKCREVFVLSRFENLSHKEISSRLKISTKTVEAQVTKALSFIRISVDKVMFFAVSLFLF
jgi:RNA polymerase sigma-70 factor (family 1)